MSISTKNALRALEKQLYAYNYAQALMSCDEATAAPPCSEAGRAEAAEVLSRAAFALLVNGDTAALLRQAAAETNLDPQLAAEVRELQRRYDEIARIPADEYAAFTRLVQQAIPAWGRAKRANDFAAFAPYLESIVEARRKQAAYFAPERHPYEVLLDRYERGLTIATVFLPNCAKRSCPCWTRSAAMAHRCAPIFLTTTGRCPRSRPWPARSCAAGGLTPTTACWPRASTLSPKGCGTAMCGSRPTICRGIWFPVCTASRMKAVTLCMN